MDSKKIAAVLIAFAALAVGCGGPLDEDPSTCSVAQVTQTVCPAGFPADQRICRSVDMTPVVDCTLNTGIKCVAACRKP